MRGAKLVSLGQVSGGASAGADETRGLVTLGFVARRTSKDEVY